MSDEMQKNIFRQNLIRLLSINGKSQAEVAKAIGVSPQTFNTLVHGIALPRMGKIQRLADYFNVYKSDLLDVYNEEDDEEGNLTVVEREVLEFYRGLNEHGKEMVVEFIRMANSIDKYKKPSQKTETEE